MLPDFVTYHELNSDIIRDVFKAFEADLDLVLGVVQKAQMEHNDLITFLQGETKTLSLSLLRFIISILVAASWLSLFLTT